MPTQLAAIVEAGVERFRDRVAGKRFAVRARRVGDRSKIPISAHSVELELGTALLPFSAGVDLGAPGGDGRRRAARARGLSVLGAHARARRASARRRGTRRGPALRRLRLRRSPPGTCSSAASRSTTCSATSAARRICRACCGWRASWPAAGATAIARASTPSTSGRSRRSCRPGPPSGSGRCCSSACCCARRSRSRSRAAPSRSSPGMRWGRSRRRRSRISP